MHHPRRRPVLVRSGRTGLDEIHVTGISARQLAAWDDDRQARGTAHPERPPDYVEQGIRGWRYRTAHDAPLHADAMFVGGWHIGSPLHSRECVLMAFEGPGGEVLLERWIGGNGRVTDEEQVVADARQALIDRVDALGVIGFRRLLSVMDDPRTPSVVTLPDRPRSRAAGSR